MKNKKVYLGIILGILIVLAVIGIWFFARNTKEKTIKLVEKSLNYSNYTMEYSSDGQSIKMQYKDNVYMIKSNIENSQTYFVYEDLNNDEIIFGDEKYALISQASKYKTEENSEYLESFSSTALSNLNSEDYEYSFIEKNKFNDENCIVVSLKLNDENKTTSDTPYEIHYTISTKTGFVYKVEEFDTEGNNTETTEIKVTLDDVTDEDVAKPDLESFDQTLEI